jgi:hypothetical protein
MMNDVFHEVILYLDLKTILKHFELFSNENLINWLNGISDEDLKKMYIRELWRRVQERHELFIRRYFERLYQIYNEKEIEKIMKKWIRFFFQFEKIVILKILIKWNIKVLFHHHLSNWIEDCIREKKSKKFIEECILLLRDIDPTDRPSPEYFLAFIKNGYFELFEKFVEIHEILKLQCAFHLNI